jgi:hypothetical protein
MNRTATVIGLAALMGAAATPASATVLMAPPARHVAQGRPLYLQLWYRQADGGSRRVTVSVWRDGKLVVRRRLEAPGRWRTYHLVRRARAGAYTTTVVGAGWRARYRTIVDGRHRSGV